MHDPPVHHWQHWFDQNDNPEGGQSYGPGYAIAWQRGPLGRHSLECGPGLPCGEGCTRIAPNGAFVESVLRACADRIEFYQRSKFACEDNAEALRLIGAACEALDRRTRDREKRSVEGTHAK